ncbi:MAG: glycosyltransferase [bacterium]|nr:glycosyltransferase [bacterium]
MKVSFIIPLYNCLPLTQAMLASLRATLPPGLEHEIILVDDGSTDGTQEWLQAVGSALVAGPGPTGNPGLPTSGSPTIRTILHEKNLGFAAACNRGAAAATGDFLFFLNNDLVLLPRWLEPMLAAFDRFPDAGLVGNIQLNAATGATDHTGIFFNHQGKPAHDTGVPWSFRWLGVPACRAVDALTGACFGLRRALWTQLGGFDEGFINGSEDIDLCLRASAAGLQNFVALRSVVRHHISASSGRKLRDEHNTFRLVSRWREKIAVLAARDWSRRFIERHWDQSFVFDYHLGQAALLYWLQVLPAPPAAIRSSVAEALGGEQQRWRELLENAAPRPVPVPVYPARI